MGYKRFFRKKLNSKANTNAYKTTNATKFIAIKSALMLIITAIVLIAISSVNGIFAAFVAFDSATNDFNMNLSTPHQITGEVIGENGTISGVPETVYEGNDMQNDVYITPSEGYKIATARVYTGDEIDGDYDDTDGTDIKANFYRRGRDGKIKLIKNFTNVTENMHIVITMETAPIVAQIVEVPGGTEGELANQTSGTGAAEYTILNHQYTTLEDAIYDAQLVNDANTNNLTGTVVIRILADIDDEINDIETNNNVTIDLNGHTIKIDNDTNKVITVKNGAKLTLINNGSEINPATNLDSEIVNLDGISIYVENGGELTLGVNDGRVKVSTPTIEGENFGLYREAGSILNFYDGKVIGDTDSAIAGDLNNINTPQLYEVVNSVEGTKEVSFISIPANIEAMIGTTKYNTLEEAFAAVENDTNNTRDGQPTEIDVVAEVTIESAVALSQNKNVVLDLNGHTITGARSNPVFTNNGKLQIKDSTAEINENYNYSELVNNGTYYFTKVGNHLEANNYGVANSTANSYIKIDLSNKTTSESFSLKINALTASESDYDIGYLTVTESVTAPAYNSSTGRFAYISNLRNPADYATTLVGGKTYYLHLGYRKNASVDDYLDTFVITSIKLNGEDLIQELPTEKGNISNSNYGVIRNGENGELLITSGRITEGSSSTSDNYAGIVNYGKLKVTGGVLRASNGGAFILRNFATGEGKIAEINGGKIWGNTYNHANATLKYNNDVMLNGSSSSTIRNEGYLEINNGLFIHNPGSDELVYPISGSDIVMNNGKIISYEYGFYLNKCNTLTINDGYFRTRNASVYANSGNPTIVIRNADMKVCARSRYVIKLECGTLTIDNVTMDETYGGGIYSEDDVVANIYNSYIKANDDGAITANDNSIVNIYSGTYKNYDYGIYTNGGTVNLYDGYIISEDIAIYNYNSNTINIYGGTVISKGDYEAIYNRAGGTINIGNKNTSQNTDISKTNPTIISNLAGIYNPSGTTKFYDGQIIAPTANIINGAISEIEKQDANGNLMGIKITPNAENETEQELGIDISSIIKENTTYERMFIDILTAVAKIPKTAIDLDFTDLANNAYYSDNDYYYFYKLSDAIKACSQSAGSNVTTIDVISDILTPYKIGEIVEGQNIKIDINGHKIKTYISSTAITNAGKLSIDDSVGTGLIETIKTVINNTGELETNVNITMLDTTKSKVNYSEGVEGPNKILISNTGNYIVSGKKITGYNAILIYNTGNLTINDGYLDGLTLGSGTYYGSWAISNRNNGRCIINGGTLKSYTTDDYGWHGRSCLLYNAETATVQINGGNLNTEGRFGILNYSSSKYEEGVSEPSLHITGGSINGVMKITSTENEVWVKKNPAKSLYISCANGFSAKGKLIIEDATISCNVKNEGTSATSATYIKNSTLSSSFESSASENRITNNSTITGAVSLSYGGSTDEINGSQTGAITKTNAGTVSIINSTIGAFNNNGAASVTIENSISNGVVTNASTGTIAIPSVGSSVIKGISNTSTGTITIGTKGDGTVSTTYPQIESVSGYAISNTNANGHICFYDGIAKAQTGKILNGSLYELEDGYDFVTHDESATHQFAILEKVAVAKILKSSINANNLVQDTYVELDENYYGFYSLQAAFNACTNNQQTEIIQIADITYTATDSSQTVSANKDIILDLAGYTINFGNENGIINQANASLKITDSSSTVGTIKGANGTIVNNSGTLIIEKVKVNEITTGTSSNYVNAIVNTGTITLEEITFTSGEYVTVVENNGTANLTDGTYNASNNNTSKVINNTGTGDVTLNNVFVKYMNVYNNNQGTIKMTDMDFQGRIVNNSTSVYQQGVSEPAIRIVGGSYNIKDCNIYNYSGEMIFENNTTHGDDSDLVTIVGVNTGGWSTTYAVIENNSAIMKFTIGSCDCHITNNGGTIEINEGTFTKDLTNSSSSTSIFTINGGTFRNSDSTGITNNANATMNLYGGYYTYTRAITNAGIMNIGNNDGTIISYPDIPLDGGNNPITNIGAPIIEGAINSTGTVNFYDGIIKANSSSEICSTYINNIPANSEIIHTKYSTYHTYSLSGNIVVATIGNTDYYTLESAFEACKNTTGNKEIIMQANIALASKASIEEDSTKLGYFEITANSDVTLDLNGKSIDGLCGKLLFVNSGTFEIKDTNSTPNGKMDTYSDGLIYNTGSLSISAGIYTVKGTNKRVIIENVGTGTILTTGGIYNVDSIFTWNDETSKTAAVISSSSKGDITLNGGIFNCKGGSYASRAIGTVLYVNNTDNNIKPTITIDNNTVFTNYEYTYGLRVNKVNLNLVGGNNACNYNRYANVITNSSVTMSGSITAGKVELTNSTLNITGGSIGGTTVVDANSSLIMSGVVATIAAVENNGTATVTAGTITGMFTNAAGKTATIDNAEFTTAGGVSNSGTLTITNSNINTSATAISNSGSGILTVTDVTVNSTGNGLAVSGGTTKLEDVTIQASGDYGVNVTGGTLNIPYETTGGTTNNTEITATAGIGLHMNGGTVNLGTEAYPAYKTSPQITGKTYGVKVDSGRFNFYDGILRSTDNDAFSGTIGRTPELYSLLFEDETKKVAYLGIQATTENVVKVGTTNYSTITSAINAINNTGKVGTIVFLKNIVITSPISIPAENDITFDMQGYTLKYSGTDAAIVNNSTLTIIDTLAATSTTIGYIDNFQGPAIENKGTLTIGELESVPVLQTRAPKVIGATYGIVSTQSGAVLYFYDGTIEGQTAPVNGIITTDTTLYTLTTGTEVRTYGTNEITYNTTYLVE